MSKKSKHQSQDEPQDQQPKQKPAEEKTPPGDDRLLRLQADFDNFRRRAGEEQSRAIQVSRVSVILELLPVIDNFDRAFAEVPEEIAQSNWYQGVAAIKKQFETVLQNLGIARIEAVGQPFDPNLHEAIDHAPSDQYDENIISEEYEAGYRWQDDVVRHARVKVSSGKKKGE